MWGKQSGCCRTSENTFVVNNRREKYGCCLIGGFFETKSSVCTFRIRIKRDKIRQGLALAYEHVNLTLGHNWLLLE